jgi:hypothetical protein
MESHRQNSDQGPALAKTPGLGKSNKSRGFSARRRFFSGSLLLAIFAMVVVVVWVKWRTRMEAAPEIVGFVLNYQGTWVRQDAPNKPLDFGTELLEDEFLVPDNADAWIEICLFSGSAKRIDARKIKTPIRLSVEPGNKISGVQRIYRAVTADYHPVAVSAVSRAPGVLNDTVVRLKEGQAELGNLMRNISEGAYLLRFEPMFPDDSSRPQTQRSEVELHWKPGEVGAVRIPASLRGVCQVTVVDSSDLSTAGDCWALLLDASAFDSAQRAYQESAGLIDRSWDKEITFASKRNFLRAYMKHLAEKE